MTAARTPTALQVSPAGVRVVRHLATAAAGALLLPPLAVSGAPVHGSPIQAAIGLLIALAVFLPASRLNAGRALPLLGAAMLGCSAWLLAQASYAGAGWVVAPLVGAGAGLSYPRLSQPPLRPAALLAGGVAAVLVGVDLGAGRSPAMALGAAVAVVAGLASATSAPASIVGGRHALAAAVPAVLLAALTTGYVGATTPSAAWFGSLVSHGPRGSEMVAVTFDDGPDDPYTLQIRDILDAYGAKATFFTVGKALDARPDISRALLADGQLLGNHSYKHDAVSWLDPAYPELRNTQDAFQRNLGICPGFFRPPHGTHTPFMSRAAGGKGMTVVTWDVSAGDWATTNGDLVAERVLEKVRPGSIILLHDGIDGSVTADRSVIVSALPRILDGLRQRGLRPVTVDQLLGKPGYVDCQR